MVNDRIADSIFQQIQTRPDEYSILATMNLNGDYLSDAAAAIVGGLIKAVPKQQSAQPTPQQLARQTEVQQEILRTAIQARPESAAEITAFALTLFPAKTAQFIEAAVAASPPAQRPEIAGLADRVVRFDTPVPDIVPTPQPSPAGGFPVQPIRPDLISPSG
jgi:hypothetical protein